MDSENSTNPRPDDQKNADGSKSPEGPRVEVSASTITRMMGIATVTDLKLIENRIDLFTAKLSNITTKLDRVVSMLSSAPAAADIDRLEIQLGAVKSMLREVLEAIPGDSSAIGGAEKEASQEQSRKLRDGIRSSSQSNE